MTNNFTNAVKAIKEMVSNGVKLSEAIKEAAWEFGELESELWGEF
jgi:uncharacterized protein YoaH (UPF0181 family)